jgi:hypothetical protein
VVLPPRLRDSFFNNQNRFKFFCHFPAENAQCLQRGEEFKFPISKKTDAIGCLEQEPDNISQILGKNDTVAKSN